MDTKNLRQKILDLAICGKLVPQDPNDEPASVLLERIRIEKENLKNKRSKKSDSDTLENEEVPFAIPDSWEWTTLGNIGIWQSGATPSRLNKDYYGGEIPWLKTGDLNDGFIHEITQKALEETSVKLNPTGSVLIAMYGATIGKVGILTCPATTNQACCACIEFQGVDQMYLFYFLLSHKDNFIMLGGGGAQPNISKEKIVDTLIPLPPIEEQKRIVAAIEQWYDLIDVLENEKSDLQASIQQAKSKILDLAIHGKLVPQDPNDEPAIELLKRINPKFETCENEENGNLPNGWEITEFQMVCKTISSKPYQILQSEIKNFGNTPVISQSANYIEGYSDREDCVLKAENPILIFGDHTRVLKYVDFNFIVGADGVKLIQTTLSAKYVYYVLLHAIQNMQGKGYARHYSILAKTQIPIPPYQEQLRIVSKIEELFAILDDIKKSLV